jgi:flagellar basal-body rod protein FlgG
MDAGLYIAASGMLAEQVRQDQLSNDLANASTPGYKPDNAIQRNFGELLLANTATGQPVGPLSTGVTISQIVTDLSPVPLHQTGQPLDFGIAGPGFFALQTGQGLRYTRDGRFQASATGQLVDSFGHPVLSPGGAPIQVDAQGRVPASALGVFNLTGAVKQGDNLFSGTAAGAALGSVRQGELEDPGVDPVHTMVDMIASLRAYEAGQKAIQSIDETLQQNANQVGSLGGA